MVNLYYGTLEDSPLSYQANSLQPLAASVKSFISEENKVLLQCPSFAASFKNTYVLKAPFDIRICPRNGTRPSALVGSIDLGSPTVGFSGGKEIVSTTICQMLDNHFLLCFADSPCMLTVTPPYLHNGNIWGFSGSYDVGRWFRALSVATYVHNEFEVKKGEPLMYLKFSKDVALHKVLWGSSAMQKSFLCADLKNYEKNNTLEQNYDLFMQSSLRRDIVRIAESSKV